MIAPRRILLVATAALAAAAACTGRDASPVGAELLPRDVLSSLRTIVTSRFTRATDYAVFPASRGIAERLTSAHDWPTATDFESRVLFRFDVAELDSLPAGTEFEPPSLRLVFIPPAADVTIRVHRVTGAWSEEAATWLQRDFGSPWTTPGGDFDPAPVATFVVPATTDTMPADTGAARADSLRVPIPLDLFEAWRTGALENHGLILVQDTPGVVVDFGSRGSTGESANGPRLDVSVLLPGSGVAADLRLIAEEDVFLPFDESPFPPGGLVVRGAEPPRRTVLEASLEDLEVGATIASVQLVLTVREADVPRDSLLVFAVPLLTEFRGENTLLASPSTVTPFTVVQPETQPGDTIVVESPVLTVLVRQWFASPESNRGIALRLPEVGPLGESAIFGGVQFHGPEAPPESRPRLRILFVPSAVPGEGE